MSTHNFEKIDCWQYTSWIEKLRICDNLNENVSKVKMPKAISQPGIEGSYESLQTYL